MTDDFSHTPPSIGEIRTDRTGHASDWSPRELLIATLREIDTGALAPSDMIVLFRHESTAGYRASTSDAMVSLGLLTRVLLMFNSDL